MKRNECSFLRGIIIDFLILCVLFFALSYFFFASFRLLYRDSEAGGQISVTTEAVPSFYENCLHNGDVIYDPITKRKIGIIDEFQMLNEGDKIRFIIKISAEHMPRADSMRTKNFWFKYSIEE